MTGATFIDLINEKHLDIDSEEEEEPIVRGGESNKKNTHIFDEWYSRAAKNHHKSRLLRLVYLLITF